MTIEALRRLLSFAGPQRRFLLLLVLMGLIASLAEGLGIGLLIPVVSLMLDADGVGTAGPFARAMEAVGAARPTPDRLLLLALLIAGLVALKTFVLVLNARLAARINGDVTSHLRIKLCSNVLGMNYIEFRTHDQGRLMNLMDVQAQRVSEALMHAISLVTATCFLLVYGGLLLMISWQLTVLVAAVAVPVSMFVRSRTRRAQAMAEELLERNSTLTGRTMELLSAMRTIRVFGQEQREVQRYSIASEESRKVFVRAETVAGTVVPTVELLYVPLFLAVLGYAWMSGLGVASLLAFLVLLYRMQPQISRIDWARVTLAGAVPGMRALGTLADTSRTSIAMTGSRPLSEVRQGITFEKVSFVYPGADIPAVCNVSLSIAAGTVCAIVGRSGSGKSTLMNLLLRLYDPSEGVVRIDGHPIHTIEEGALRTALAFAGQDAELLSGTVRDNISYGASQAPFEDIVRAASDAHAEEFIRSLPQGYETEVGVRGGNLSGGQRQRIALARALVRRPLVLVLDEATNAVDNLAESAIHETIEKLAGRCTIIIVAHRLSTVRLANQVVVMAGGRVVESGTPEAVIGLGGEFSAMYELR